MTKAIDSGRVEAEKISLDFNLYIICQKEKKEILVEKPCSYKKVYKIHRRMEIWRIEKSCEVFHLRSSK